MRVTAPSTHLCDRTPSTAESAELDTYLEAHSTQSVKAAGSNTWGAEGVTDASRPWYRFDHAVPRPTEPGLYVFEASASADTSWGDQDSAAQPRLPPQSHMSNARTNQDWSMQVGDHKVMGHTVWRSNIICVTVLSSAPTPAPSGTPTASPSGAPTGTHTPTPSIPPAHTATPSAAPSETPSAVPSSTPTTASPISHDHTSQFDLLLSGTNLTVMSFDQFTPRGRQLREALVDALMDLFPHIYAHITAVLPALRRSNAVVVRVEIAGVSNTTLQEDLPSLPQVMNTLLQQRGQRTVEDLVAVVTQYQPPTQIKSSGEGIGTTLLVFGALGVLLLGSLAGAWLYIGGRRRLQAQQLAEGLGTITELPTVKARYEVVSVNDQV
eukprot:TRINITY_DN9927_c0_g1_i3.p1 TRINITY_DN9927_c0_g1~~TRINITY_DN9927_c0_g1_i3.p1  ORF type:complete len:381 (-),score=68.45 TRINITY_DN9927_c0_g1_i3:59-1201(-)